ncbi:rhamnan synthesis F family protein [Roseobacter sp. YSTF-M11]|uniref:Rhamnan synthesis F family protein n=1 Tax=Roseobacter insulae TaxID=2859783 RepID=A0A9X1G1F1_9RHOB|nr:rhamnan synthesis F family protein [Roseobacter insulae]MBW4710813.1 rhamnan synthesis F family protein [Roseobacter insulae]
MIDDVKQRQMRANPAYKFKRELKRLAQHMRNPLIPANKLKRELLRIGRQIINLPPFVISYLFATPYYDLVLARKCKILDGKAEPKNRIAVYLFYPQKGLQKSHLRAIDYLAQSGYAPLVICNAPLDDAELCKVLGRCWRYIERPNFGYDFGGYRDGILSIKTQLGSLDRLILTNDSTWFPLPGAMDWIAASEALNVDYAGAAWAWAVRHEDPEDFEKIQWTVDKDRRNFHYASYALNIASPILRTKKFYRFWKNFRLTNEKNRTVRRGEIGLTTWVKKHGFSHGATTELMQISQLLNAKNDDEVLNLVENLIFVTDPKMKDITEAFLKDAQTSEPFPRKRAEQLIANAVARQGMSYSIMGELIENHGFAFMKKSPAFRNDGTDAIVQNILTGMDAKFRKDILGEISALDR